MEKRFGDLGRGNSSNARNHRPTRTKLADLLDNITIPEDTVQSNPVQNNTVQSDATQKSALQNEIVQDRRAEARFSTQAVPENQSVVVDEQQLRIGQDDTSQSGVIEEKKFKPSGQKSFGTTHLSGGLSEGSRDDLIDSEAASNADFRLQDDAAQASHAFRATMNTQEKADRDADRPNNSINIKGRADGISIEIGRGKWSELVAELSERLRQASGFFRGGRVTLDVGIRPLQADELKQIVAVLEQHSMTLGVIKTTSEQTCQIALANGLAASLDAVDGLQAQPAYSNTESLHHFVYRGNIRSGQILQRTETVLILGDVNPGAQVISHGDILVWGRLRGIVHAGANGDLKAVIAALAMQPTQIRIAHLTAILPEEKPARNSRWRSGQMSFHRPEIAFASGEQIVVDPWDESKPGGIMAFRR